MSSFRDTFTKEEKKDNLLGYDDSAFLFFAGTILACILVPWTWKFVSTKLSPEAGFKDKSNCQYCQCSLCVTRLENEKKNKLKWSQRMIWEFFAQLAILVILWGIFIWVALMCTQTSEIQSFDPFSILEIDSSATDKQIKKAYRVMSLKFHPDKNPNDPNAGAKFIMITKAYQSLTDEISKRNFEKYGNPDGPVMMKIGLGLPQFLVKENYQIFFLILFFTILLIIIPLFFICYYRRIRKYAQNGMQIETLQFLSYYMSEGTRIKNGPELLAGSAESREVLLSPSDNTDMLPLVREVVEPRKRQFSLPIIVRNYFLILGHMQRLHSHMVPHLRRALDEVLQKSTLVTESMIEIAMLSNWFLTLQSMIDFQRSIVQCLGFRNSSLLQIPHVDEEVVKHCLKGKNVARELRDFMKQSPEERKTFTRMNHLQLADISAFCGHVSDMEIKAELFVDDESEIVVGDVCTIRIKMTRKNLREGECMGPVHAPLFPCAKYEHWWICALEETGGLLGFAKTRSQEKYIEDKIQFPARKAGKQTLVVHFFCDSYSGIDQTIQLPLRVYTEKEVKREVFVHPDDIALDNEPTLFQQMLGPLAAGEDSSDEEGAEDGAEDGPEDGAEDGAGNDDELVRGDDEVEVEGLDKDGVSDDADDEKTEDVKTEDKEEDDDEKEEKEEEEEKDK